jgi:hypothetical protein
MTLSMLVLVAIVLVLTAVTTGFSFHLGGPNPHRAGKVLTPQNPREDLQSVAGEVGFPLLLPRVPQSWQANSFAKQSVDSGPGSVADVYVGWVTGDGNYLRLDQTAASVNALVKLDRHQNAGSTSSSGSLRKLDEKHVAGSTWAVYPGTRSEHTWVLDRGSARVAITGDGTPGQFRTMAKAVLAAPAVTARG